MPSGRLVARNEAEVQFVLGSGRQGVGLPDRARRLPLPVADHLVRAGADGGTCPPGMRSRTSTSTGRSSPIACSATRTGSSRWRARSTGIGRRSSGATRSAASDATGLASSMSKGPRVVDGRDLTIVNPAGLEPSLRDAVCEQCHLIGHRRIARLDRRAEDYRPGLPFHQFWTVLEPSAGRAENRFVGQVEQMHESRCFRASRGRLGCISCHDPHQLPAPEEKVAYYRDRCLECHADRGCRLPAAVRLERSRDDDCAGCHMPRSRSSDILHAAATSHRILRHADEPDRSPVPTVEPRDRQRPVVNFHRELMDERERAEAERDIGVALCRDGPEGAAVALPLLEAALAARPDDVTAWESKGFALGQLGRGNEALAAFRTALAKEPNRESALTGAAYLAARGGTPRRRHRLRAARTSPSAPGDRITTPSWPLSTSKLAIGTRPPRPAGRPSASTPPTSRSGSSSSGAISASRTSRPPAGNSRPSWDSIPPTGMSSSAGSHHSRGPAERA